MEKMPGHPRLYRPGAVYWHRAAVPVDIADTYPKTEETFSLRTKDRNEALKLVRVEAARVDRLFDEHRKRVAVAAGPTVDELTDAQVKAIGEAYYAMLLQEDDARRLGEFEGTSFDEHSEDIAALSAVARHEFARGEISDFDADEARNVSTTMRQPVWQSRKSVASPPNSRNAASNPHISSHGRSGDAHTKP